MAWVWMALADSDAAPVKFPDDPDVVAAQEARGYVEVSDDYVAEAARYAEAAAAVEPDEVDGRGQGWIYLEHPEVGGPARYPVEVADDMYAQGWTRPGDEEEEPADLEDQTKADLQAQLKELGLPTSGTKQELIDRLSEYDAPVESETEEQ